MHKGRRLKAPGNLPVRPTADRTKEALFNILGHDTYWPETTVLDLFAGTGNLSYECGSRGSPSIVAVDAHKGCVRFIEQTSEMLGLPITVYKRDVMAFLKQAAGTFDLIFADPPYEFSEEQLAGIVALCQSNALLAEEGKLIVEHSADRDLSNLPGFEQARRYGGTVFSFFGREP